MRLTVLLVATLWLLSGCTQAPTALAPVAKGELTPVPASAERALQKSLDEVLEQGLASARQARTPREAERQARAAFEQWAKGRGEELQFQVQALPASNAGLQLQMQAQMTSGEQTVQVQHQWVVRPFPAR